MAQATLLGRATNWRPAGQGAALGRGGRGQGGEGDVPHGLPHRPVPPSPATLP